MPDPPVTAKPVVMRKPTVTEKRLAMLRFARRRFIKEGFSSVLCRRVDGTHFDWDLADLDEAIVRVAEKAEGPQ